MELKPVTIETALLIPEVLIVLFIELGTEVLADMIVKKISGLRVEILKNHGFLSVRKSMKEKFAVIGISRGNS